MTLFAFKWCKKPRMDFLRPYQRLASVVIVVCYFAHGFRRRLRLCRDKSADKIADRYYWPDGPGSMPGNPLLTGSPRQAPFPSAGSGQATSFRLRSGELPPSRKATADREDKRGQAGTGNTPLVE